MDPWSTEQTPSVASDSKYFEPFHPMPAPGATASRHVWLGRVLVVLFVALCIEVGILLTVLPWYGRIWTDNGFMLAHPALRALAAQNFVRGIVTGLGLVDIWLGIWEAARYREPAAEQPPPPAVS